MEKNNLANAALGVSIGIIFTGIIFAFIPFVGIIINAIPLILGIISLRKIKQNPNLSGKVKSIIAIVISSLFTLYAMFGTFASLFPNLI